jgi:hypothetical protein
MLKPENKFRKWFIEKAEGYLCDHYPDIRTHYQKHADMVAAGIPDMDIAICGITMWIEFKLLETCKEKRKIKEQDRHTLLTCSASATPTAAPAKYCPNFELFTDRRPIMIQRRYVFAPN